MHTNMCVCITLRFITACCTMLCSFLNGCAHIDQLTRIMHLVGTPSSELLSKITSEEVRFFQLYYNFLNYYFLGHLLVYNGENITWKRML